MDTIKEYFIKYFPYVVVFTGSIYNSADADLGWHLKYGQYFFFNQAILLQNIYSTMMMGYKWINSSWMTDLITHFTFNNFGFYGLSILGALVVTTTFYFFARAAKLKFWHQAFIFPLLLHLEEPLTQVSFRGHLLSLMFLGLLFYLLHIYKEGQKKILIFTIPLFALWSNLHGEFILGLAIFAIWIFFYSLSQISDRSNLRKLILHIKFPFFILLFSSLAVMINPYGINVYLEPLRHFNDPLLKYIVEWLPFSAFSEFWWKLIAWGIMLLTSLIIIYRKKKIDTYLPDIICTVLLFALSLQIRRYIWPMLLISLPLVKIFFETIKIKNNKLLLIIPSIIFITVYIFNVYIKNPSLGVGHMNWNNYCNWYLKCSPASAEYLIKNKLTKNILTFYNWGGWLIWNYPSIKPSIDGRMHLWKDENGYSAFIDYYKYEQDFADINKSEYNIVYFTPDKPLFKQMMNHVENGSWRIVYRDQYAYVFVRNSLRL